MPYIYQIMGKSKIKLTDLYFDDNQNLTIFDPNCWFDLVQLMMNWTHQHQRNGLNHIDESWKNTLKAAQKKSASKFPKHQNWKNLSRDKRYERMIPDMR